jgi:hypothetical protein
MAKAFRITAPFLTEEERHMAAQAGGLSGQTVDTEKLVGEWNPRERKFGVAPILHGLQSKAMYLGVDPAVVAERRRRNKQARKSRRANRKAGK